MQTFTRNLSARPIGPLRQIAVAVALAMSNMAAHSNPQGAQIIQGQVSMVSTGKQLAITNSPGAIIHWQNFSIGAGEVTRFIQQSAQSSVLNRVVGQDPSRILGALQSNGRVFVINPNGILFGAGSRVDVNGLVASSLQLSNEDFMAGRLQLNGTPSSGEVHNQGVITTPSGGQVYLIAPSVTNSGVITSPQGDVVLAAGQSVKLADASDPSIRVVVSAPQDQALNMGTVVAQGGKVGIYATLIRQRGLVSANSAVRGENGKILFKASGDTLLEEGSTTSATGVGQGGEVVLLGDRVGLLGNAQVDASGQTGGGTVLVGGDYLGANSAVANATRTYVGADASIKADALDNGDGGKVIVWSDESTRVHGSISARGGSQGGSGGFVETSGHALNVAGVRVDARAPKGNNGTWLLDPFHIEVRSTANGGSAVLTDFDAFADSPASGVSVVSADTIAASASNVILQATGDITFVDAVHMTTAGVGLSATAQNAIRVNNSVSTNNGAINLVANGAGIVVNTGGTLSSGGAAIGLNTSGAIALAGGSIQAAAGGVVLAAGTAIAQSGGLISGASLDASAASGIGSTGAPLLTSVGDLTAVNSDGGNSAIAIRNTGPLHIQRLSQSGASTGGIVVDNSADLTVDAGATISNERGATVLTSRGPLTVNGNVGSASGSITLQAASTGRTTDTVTISSTGRLLTSGAVLLQAGSTITTAGSVSGGTVTEEANRNPVAAPSAGLCTFIPYVALCQVLSPPTASEPVKPVQLASNEVIKTVSSSTHKVSGTNDVKVIDVNTADTQDQKASKPEGKTDDTKELASNDRTGAKNETTKKMYCN